MLGTGLLIPMPSMIAICHVVGRGTIIRNADLNKEMPAPVSLCRIEDLNGS